LLNSLLQEIPAQERLILIEDTPELRISHANSVGLLAVKGDQGEALVKADDLLQAALRMRPDRIILGELRGAEAYTFLRAVNTGHPGSLTTIHADSPERAIEQLALIVLQTGTQLSRQDIVHYVRSTVDLVVQLERRDGKRIVSQMMTTRT
jgi:type IV secretion system protein VirB11